MLAVSLVNNHVNYTNKLIIAWVKSIITANVAGGETSVWMDAL